VSSSSPTYRSLSTTQSALLLVPAFAFRLRRATFVLLAGYQPSLEERRLVGLSRFELLTPRLSSVCSNQLSYRPELSNAVKEPNFA
jgi:hypothetical protein